MPLAPLSVTSLTSHKWIVSFQVLIPRWVGLSHGLPVRLGVSPTKHPPQVFTARGFEAFFTCAGTMGCAVCLAPQLFLPTYPPSLPVTALPHFLSPQLPDSAPPTSLDECFFFNSLVVRLPCSLIFWQFWLFFVFKLVGILLLVVQRSKAKCIYIRVHLGQNSPQLSTL